MTTYIIGHQKPDTDAVVAAMAVAYLYRELNGLGRDNPIPVITEGLNPETEFLFNKFGVETPKTIAAKDITSEDQVVLVDHNEESQRLEGLNPDNIVEIIDHHKANLNLATPIHLTFKPWGASSTIVYHIMKQNDVVPDKILASLMLAAILSDTVGFKSATTTTQDQALGRELGQIAEIDDIDAFTLEIFKAKSDVSSLTDEEIVKNDYKIFEFSKKTMINQVETVEQSYFTTEKKEELLNAMQRVKEELQTELLFVAVTDILQVNTKLLILSDAEKAVAEEAFGGTTSDSVLDIGPKMSRKKEIAPAIEAALA